MGALGNLIKALAGSIAEFVASIFGKKVTLAGAAVATFGVLTAGFYAAVTAMLATITLAFPESGSVTETMMWAATPPQVTGGVAVALSFDTAYALYRWNVENVKMAAYVT